MTPFQSELHQLAQTPLWVVHTLLIDCIFGCPEAVPRATTLTRGKFSQLVALALELRGPQTRLRYDNSQSVEVEWLVFINAESRKRSAPSQQSLL